LGGHIDAAQAPTHAVDQGPVVLMIENDLSGLIWRDASLSVRGDRAVPRRLRGGSLDGVKGIATPGVLKGKETASRGPDS
jgi:hypothetical protein